MTAETFGTKAPLVVEDHMLGWLVILIVYWQEAGDVGINKSFSITVSCCDNRKQTLLLVFTGPFVILQKQLQDRMN